jgi:hypothetical protein
MAFALFAFCTATTGIVLVYDGSIKLPKSFNL